MTVIDCIICNYIGHVCLLRCIGAIYFESGIRFWKTWFHVGCT